jgi:hypothetical protein
MGGRITGCGLDGPLSRRGWAGLAFMRAATGVIEPVARRLAAWTRRSVTPKITGQNSRGRRPALAAYVSGNVILKLCRSPVSKSKTLLKSSRVSSLVLRICPTRIRLNTISPKSPVEVIPQLRNTS